MNNVMGAKIPTGWVAWSSGFNEAGNPTMRFRAPGGKFASAADFASAGGYMHPNQMVYMAQNPGQTITGKANTTSFFTSATGKIPAFLGKGIGFLGKILGGVLKIIPVVGTIFTIISNHGTQVKKKSRDL